tara:strand:+ start:1451 stop:2218 length:768 start_codon:yes stop_codon:yes gene_type:complete
VDPDALLGLLTSVESGEVSPDDAVRQLSRLPFADLGAARIDHHRVLRQGLPEAVYGPGKSPDDVAVVVAELLEHGTGPVVLSRADEDQVTKALGVDPSGMVLERTVVWRRAVFRPDRVLVVTAGTADRPVADECAAVLWAHGLEPDRLIDVGVAGLHRLLADVGRVQDADVVVVVAGMEGALASVVGGLTGAPVVAVPTSVGYGASLEGVTALLGMMASCASGLTVVGIDNGFGAACAALRILGPASSSERTESQ